MVVHTGRDEATETARRVREGAGRQRYRASCAVRRGGRQGPLHLAPDDDARAGHRYRGCRRRPEGRRGLRDWCSCWAATARSCGPPNWPATPTFRCWGSTWAASASWPRPRPSIDRVLDHVVDAGLSVEDRMTLDVVVRRRRRVSGTGWALNEASLEKGPGWASSAWSSRSTADRSRRSAATGCWCRRPPDPPPTRSPQADRCCGRTSRQSWWCRTMPTHCSAGPWSPAPMPPSRSRSRPRA